MKDTVQYQVGFKLPLALSVRGEAFSVLMAQGYDPALIVEEETRSLRTISFYWQDKRSAVKALAVFKSMKVPRALAFCRVHRERDWSSRWKKGWKPFPLTRRFHVVPLWQDDRHCPLGKIPIYLDTTNAFGTGLHETTRFTSQLIESLAGSFVSFLDVGTGSGILAIIGLKCGARKVVGFDIDPSAVKVSRQNLKVNGLACALKACDVKDFKSARPFDLVAANLVSPDLIEFRGRILSFVRPGGHLVVSGISLKNIPRVKKAFVQAGARPVKTLQGREWAAMLFKI